MFYYFSVKSIKALSSFYHANLRTVSTYLYTGQGLGNQLWVYAVTLALASKFESAHQIKCPWRFKGKDFLQLDHGRRSIYFPRSIPHKFHFNLFSTRYLEKKIYINGLNLDFTKYQEIPLKGKRKIILEGNFESESYLLNISEKLRDDLQVRTPVELSENLCVINIRGGDYLGNPLILLGADYYESAILKRKEIFANLKFLIVTDDSSYAKLVLPNFPILSQETAADFGINSQFKSKIQLDFTVIQNAKKLIIPNSSFSWWGAWTNRKEPYVIAPRFWDAYNSDLQMWAPGSILTKDWNWLGSDGLLRNYDEEVFLLKDFRNNFSYKKIEIIESNQWVIGKPKYRIRSFIFNKFSSFFWFRKLNSIRKIFHSDIISEKGEKDENSSE